MKKNQNLNKIIISSILLGLFLTACNKHQAIKNGFKYGEAIKVEVNMILSSPVFLHNQYIPAKYSCNGLDINPPLRIKGVPAGAQSLAFIVDDPDAPNGDWVHWLVWNIKPEIKEIEENSVPVGAVQGITSFGQNKWGGPCPPTGTHHYHFKLYALDKVLDLGTQSNKAELEQAMNGHILETSELVGLYKRN